MDDRIVKRLALRLAEYQLKDRDLRTETLYVAIAKFVATAKRESGWNRKRILDKAAETYGVSKRTVETAIKAKPMR